MRIAERIFWTPILAFCWVAELIAFFPVFWCVEGWKWIKKGGA
jgi:hypothetical protein